MVEFISEVIWLEVFYVEIFLTKNFNSSNRYMVFQIISCFLSESWLFVSFRKFESSKFQTVSINLFINFPYLLQLHRIYTAVPHLSLVSHLNISNTCSFSWSIWLKPLTNLLTLSKSQLSISLIFILDF